MKKLLTIAVLCLLVAGNCQAATLQEKLAGFGRDLLGIEDPVPAKSRTLAALEAVAEAPGPTTFVTVWAMGTSDLDSQENEFVGRVGVQLEDVEMGLESVWQGVHGDGQAYGAYVLMHLLGEPGVLGKPYLGYHATIIDAEDGGAYGPIAGTKYELGANLETVLEGWYRDFTGNLKQTAESNDIWKLFAGVRYKF